MFDVDATTAPSNGAASWSDTISVADDRPTDGRRAYVTGDGTERAAWALRCYLRAARGGNDARPLPRSA